MICQNKKIYINFEFNIYTNYNKLNLNDNILDVIIKTYIIN